MRKFISILAALAFSVMTLCADEAILFDYTVKADVLETGYDWVENAGCDIFSSIAAWVRFPALATV